MVAGESLNGCKEYTGIHYRGDKKRTEANFLPEQTHKPLRFLPCMYAVKLIRLCCQHYGSNFSSRLPPCSECPHTMHVLQLWVHLLSSRTVYIATCNQMNAKAGPLVAGGEIKSGCNFGWRERERERVLQQMVEWYRVLLHCVRMQIRRINKTKDTNFLFPCWYGTRQLLPSCLHNRVPTLHHFDESLKWCLMLVLIDKRLLSTWAIT